MQSTSISAQNQLQRYLIRRKHTHQQAYPVSLGNSSINNNNNNNQPYHLSPFVIVWERNPYNPYKFFEPPRFVPKNQIFAIQFRVLLDVDVDHGPIYLIVYVQARLQSEDKKEYALALERMMTNQLQRVTFYLPRTGVYTLEILMVPYNGIYNLALYRHDRTITVFDSEYEQLYVGASEHKALLGLHKTVDNRMGSRNVKHFDTGVLGSLSSLSMENVDIISAECKHLGSSRLFRHLSLEKESDIRQWLDLIPEESSEAGEVDSPLPGSASDESVDDIL